MQNNRQGPQNGGEVVLMSGEYDRIIYHYVSLEHVIMTVSYFS